jgi:hypothetical protein
MPLQQTSGNVTADAYGGGVAAVPNYIEDVFSTYLYTAAGATQNVNNGIDLSTKGGLLWIKARTSTGVAGPNMLMDSANGFNKYLISNQTTAQQTFAAGDVITATTTGFSVPNNVSLPNTNYPPNTYASWTFRKQPKFFDVVTWTGNGANNRTISHSLASTPGCIFVKRTDTTSNWIAWHTSTDPYKGQLNTTAAFTDTNSSIYGVNSTGFLVDNFAESNASGGTYVAYLYANNAGGFGLTGTDNVISCGSFAGNVGAYVNLGYEPQWILCKRTDGTGNWFVVDNMRGFPAEDNFSGPTNSSNYLLANTSAAESSGLTIFTNATGFYPYAFGVTTYIYIAIRKGPMKVPTDATKVFAPIKQAGGGTVTTNFPVDLGINTKPSGVFNKSVVDRLRGVSTTSYPYLLTETTAAEVAGSGYGFGFDNNTGYKDNAVYGSGETPIYWNFRRAPSFFDEVCYTGDGTSSKTITHNLTVVPELIITKRRDSTTIWFVGTQFGSSSYLYGKLNQTAAVVSLSYISGGGNIINSQPTSTSYVVDNNAVVNASGGTYVSYLFATCAGVSKVGSYTGNGTTQTINCGFGAGGARFVLIKRTDSTGDWYVYDTARGMTTLTDPYLLLNSTAAESATLGSVTTVSTGFAVNASILAAINTNGASYIYLSIA